MTRADTSRFYEDLPVHTSFRDVTVPANFSNLPDDWLIGLADIRGSTKAVADGQYKTINMVGAAVISAQINVIKGEKFPFVFGGDGSTFAISPVHEKASRMQLAAVRRWAYEEFGMDLRAALVPVREIYEAGNQVGVARFAASQGVDYAMFRGGGIHWAEVQLKSDRFEVEMAEAGEIPDLTGLSCRWQTMKSQHGSIVSLVIAPTNPAQTKAFDELSRQLILRVEKMVREGRPVPDQGPGVGWPPAGLALEAHASHGTGSLVVSKLKLLLETLLVWVLFKLKIKLGDFDPIHYQVTSGNNSDFRKFEDGLKMTLDCSQKDWLKLERILDAAEKKGIIHYGSYMQDESMMTCIVPSVMSDDHFHFIDGADGGYTLAASSLKKKLKNL